MKDLLTYSRILAVSGLLAGNSWAFAQSLGAPAGELWIGQPLELTIPARFQSTDSRDTCVQAEVAYGGAQLAPSQVRTTVLGEDEHRRVRISVKQVVDEPVVTVSLRIGCASTVTRSYTLLPDMPSEAVLARLMQPAPALAQAAPAPSMLATRAEAAGSRLRLTPAFARASGASPLRGAKLYRAAAGAPAPRLRLDAIEADTHALLRVSADLSPPGDAARRATAALLWQAISAEPQDLMRSSAALQKLETDLAQLRQVAGSTHAEVVGLRRQLDQAQPWYLQQRVVQGLVLLVIGAAAALAFLTWRGRRHEQSIPWYAPSGAAPLEPALAAAQPIARERTVAAPVQRRAESPAPMEARPQPLAPTDAQSAPDTPAELRPLDFDFAPADVAPLPHAGTSAALRVETLAAIFEEVEFLASLGLHSDAMDVIKAYLEDSARPAPVAFFELMRVCSLADDAQAVDAVRRRYAQLHGGTAPTLQQVTQPGGLEVQRPLAERVARAWGTPDALAVIEHALFDVPATDAPLTVEAARDLIVLYDVAMHSSVDGAGVRDAHDLPLAPWAHAEHPHEAHAMARAAAEDFGGHRFAVDVDLSIAPQVLPERPREPDPQEVSARLLAEKEAAREAAARAAAEAEEAFNAAVASERATITSRY